MSSVLSAADITDLRAAVSSLFPDTADVYHRSNNASGGTYGGSKAAYPVVPDIAGVPVLFDQRTSDEIEKLAVDQTTIDQVFTFPGGTDIRQTDRLVISAQTWEVVGIGGGGSWEVTKTVTARRVV